MKLFSIRLLPLLSAFVTIPVMAADLTAHLPVYVSKVIANGSPLQLQGEPQLLGKAAPNFTVANAQLQPVQRLNFTGKYLLIQTLPSLDTELGRQLANEFIRQTAPLGAEVSSLLITADLAFAQSRFAAGVDLQKVTLFSDAIWGDFGSSFGLRIKDIGLLTTALLVIGPDGTLLHQQLSQELEQQPDFPAAFKLLPLTATQASKDVTAEETKKPNTAG
jgi:thiol peroxidase